jgi:branched-chain amino acid transport system ATP-binding protein
MLDLSLVDVHRGDIKVLWSVSLAAQEEKITALLGSNGAGKTTLLNAITGLLRVSRGTIMLKGSPIQSQPVHKIVEMGVSLVPEGRRLFAEMTVHENLELGAFTRRARNHRKETTELIFRIFPVLEGRRSQVAGTLSGGEQQMLTIARALMSLPKLLLLDELSWGLSPVATQNIFKTIKEINQTMGLTILMVEQNVSMTLEMADYGYVLENGRIVGEGHAGTLLESEQVRDAYLGIGDA